LTVLLPFLLYIILRLLPQSIDFVPFKIFDQQDVCLPVCGSPDSLLTRAEVGLLKHNMFLTLYLSPSQIHILINSSNFFSFWFFMKNLLTLNDLFRCIMWCGVMLW